MLLNAFKVLLKVLLKVSSFKDYFWTIFFERFGDVVGGFEDVVEGFAGSLEGWYRNVESATQPNHTYVGAFMKNM